MPIIKLVEKCQRCPREDEVEVTLDEAVARAKSGQPRKKALVIILDGKEAVSYDYLCEECRGIVSAYCQGAQKQVKKSTRRFKKVKAEPSERSPSPVTSRPPPRALSRVPEVSGQDG